MLLYQFFPFVIYTARSDYWVVRLLVLSTNSAILSYLISLLLTFEDFSVSPAYRLHAPCFPQIAVVVTILLSYR